MADLKTVDIEGVELARPGEWMGGDGHGRPVKVKLTLGDLEAAVAAHKRVAAANGDDAAEFPVKIGHAMRQAVFGKLANELADGEPAYGWGTNLRLVGDRLVADFKRVPARLADFLKAGAWRRRSIEFGRNWPVAGAREPFHVTAVSLLGSIEPAVEGLADLYAAGAVPDGGEAFVVTCAKGDDDALTADELDRALGKLAALVDELEPYFRGRPGAPAARMMFAEWKKQLGRVARLRTEETHMRQAVLALIGAADDADDATVKVALAKADATAASAVIRLALNADAALAVVAEILGMPGATTDEIVAAIRELTGAAPAEDSTGDGVVPGQPTEETMSNPTDARITALERQVAEAKAEAARATVTLARRDAEAKADRDIAANSLPASIRETLVTLSVRGDDDLYTSVIENSQRVPTGERGTSAGSEAATEPTDAELAVWMAAGIPRDEAITILKADRAKAGA